MPHTMDTCISTQYMSMLEFAAGVAVYFVCIKTVHWMALEAYTWQRPLSETQPVCYQNSDMMLRNQTSAMNWRLFTNKARVLHYMKRVGTRKHTSVISRCPSDDNRRETFMKTFHTEPGADSLAADRPCVDA
jgi:hypothetical protein